uniref:dITP/XTP pyrophosphatase n=1 Tax=Hydrogenobacter sp. TaxID=2152829 RepID=A0A7C2V4P6_9AQUI
MLNRLLLATTNKGKIREIKEIFEGSGIELMEPEREIEVEEDGNSFLENAYKKARAYYEAYRIPSLAEDSGLVIPALGGYPGAFSSRFYSLEWGGIEKVEDSKDKANIRKVLRLMEGIEDRRAYFITFAVVYMDEAGLWSQGRCEGQILYEPRGSGGFGYDPIFQPEGYTKSMAELSAEEKNLISHRGRAIRNLLRLIKMLK